MRIAVVSDSHGNKKAIDKIFNNYKFDHFVFLGDGVEDLGLYINLPNVHIVRGNCDFFSDYPLEQKLDFDGVKILITHGHKYMVKFTTNMLSQSAVEQGAQLALFGHTHKFCDVSSDGVRLINPGALKNNTFALIEICQDNIVVKKENLI